MMKNTLDRPIFVIAIHRTGSTLLKNIIDKNSEVAMATDEMQLYIPFSKTFGKQFQKFDDLSKDENAYKLIEFIYSGKIKGQFWNDFIQLGIPKEIILEKFKKSDRTLEAIITILLDEYRKIHNKKRTGVKYPLHFSKSKLLKEWYPDSKLVLLHRNVKAICASKIYDGATIKRRKRYGFIAKYITLLAFILDYIWQARYYKRNKNMFYLIKYENLIQNPKEELKNLCKFCDIPLEEKMFLAEGKASSHSNNNTVGFKPNLINKGIKRLNNFDRWLINLLTKNSAKVFD